MKPKTNMWSLVGYGIGTLFSIGWAGRYMVLFPDRNIGLLGVMFGFGVVAWSWVYEKIRSIDRIVEEQKQTIDSRFTDVYEYIDEQKEVQDASKKESQGLQE